jgi:hypothetical protein
MSPIEIDASAVAAAVKDPGKGGVLRVAGGASLPVAVVWFFMQQSFGSFQTEMRDGLRAAVSAAQASSIANDAAIRDLRYEVGNLRGDLSNALNDRIGRAELSAWIREFRAANASNPNISIPEPPR